MHCKWGAYFSHQRNSWGVSPATEQTRKTHYLKALQRDQKQAATGKKGATLDAPPFARAFNMRMGPSLGHTEMLQEPRHSSGPVASAAETERKHLGKGQGSPHFRV